MKFFYGVHRKLSIFPIFLFIVGWMAYLAGFVKRMQSPSSLLPRWDNYPAIVAVAMGPILILSTLLQSCLSGTPSAAMGTIAGVGAVLFLVSIGNGSITTAQTLYHYNRTVHHLNQTVEVLSIPFVSATLTGAILCSLSITLLLSLWSYYRYHPPTTTGRQPIITLQDTDSVDGRPSPAFCRFSVFPGCARKLAVPCLMLAFLGWCVMVAGHQWRTNSFSAEARYTHDVFLFNFGQWGACVLTPILLIFATIQAAFSGPASSAMGVATAILNGLVLTSIGYYIIHDVGEWLKNACEKKCDYSLPENAGAMAEIVGAFVTCFFWGSVVSFWPFYSYKKGGYSSRQGRGALLEDESGLLTPTGVVQHRGYHSDDDEGGIQL